MVRPELGSTDALVMMMDARGMLYELKASVQLVVTQTAHAPARIMLYNVPSAEVLRPRVNITDN